ncbi:hypothetical protein [Haloferula sp.]|uniref:hypothetical protein n=1 Tax=Haloferula sp. TaxID=2497595 RepID=UPI003C751DA6
MNRPPLQSQRRNQIGFGLMLLGVAVFIAFHFVSSRSFVGWKAWLEFYDETRSGRLLKDQTGLLIYSGFITLSLVVIGCPSGIHWLRRSRLLKWVLVVMTLLSAGTIWYFILRYGSNSVLLTLATAPTLTLAGLLCLKPEPPPSPPGHS